MISLEREIGVSQTDWGSERRAGIPGQVYGAAWRHRRQGNISGSQQLGRAKSKKQRAAEDIGGRQKSDQRVPYVSLRSSDFIVPALGCHELFVSLVMG